MIEVEFIYNGIQTVMNSIPEEKIKYTCIKFADTIGKDINSILFIYKGQIVNIDFTFVQYMDIDIEKSNRMTLLVNEIINSAPTPTGNTIDISSEKYELRNKIDLLNKDIREIIKILNNVMDNMELFYKMKYENNINNINVSINYNKDILNDINKVINETYINSKIDNIINIYNKFNNKNIIKMK